MSNTFTGPIVEQAALTRLNPSLPAEVPDDAFCKPTRREGTDSIVFEGDGGRIVKTMVGCHQFHTVRVAVGEKLRVKALATIILRGCEGQQGTGPRLATEGSRRRQKRDMMFGEQA